MNFFFLFMIFISAKASFAQSSAPQLSEAQQKQIKMLQDAQQREPVTPAPPVQQMPAAAAATVTPAQTLQQPPIQNTGDSKQLPSDFEFISISPYFKNKVKIGRLTATVQAQNNEVLGTLTGEFGDCKSCIRGASIKGKIGIRIYGKDLRSLTVSRKQSSSIHILACPTGVPLVNGSYACDFKSGGQQMKINLRIDP